MLLLTTNHQSLIATKTSRIVKEAQGRPVMEFGARRAHGINAAVEGARAAIIGGAIGTSCTLSAKEFNVPASGTMAHSGCKALTQNMKRLRHMLKYTQMTAHY